MSIEQQIFNTLLPTSTERQIVNIKPANLTRKLEETKDKVKDVEQELSQKPEAGSQKVQSIQQLMPVISLSHQDKLVAPNNSHFARFFIDKQLPRFSYRRREDMPPLACQKVRPIQQLMPVNSLSR